MGKATAAVVAVITPAPIAAALPGFAFIQSTALLIKLLFSILRPDKSVALFDLSIALKLFLLFFKVAPPTAATV